MSEDDEFELKPEQWETLKALRSPTAAASARKHRFAIDLLALGPSAAYLTFLHYKRQVRPRNVK